jgi:hypothetical protein
MYKTLFKSNIKVELIILRAVVVVIVWWCVLDTTLCDKVCQRLAADLWSVLSVEETGVPRENHWPVASSWEIKKKKHYLLVWLFFLFVFCFCVFFSTLCIVALSRIIMSLLNETFLLINFTAQNTQGQGIINISSLRLIPGHCKPGNHMWEHHPSRPHCWSNSENQFPIMITFFNWYQIRHTFLMVIVTLTLSYIKPEFTI